MVERGRGDICMYGRVRATHGAGASKKRGAAPVNSQPSSSVVVGSSPRFLEIVTDLPAPLPTQPQLYLYLVSKFITGKTYCNFHLMNKSE